MTPAAEPAPAVAPAAGLAVLLAVATLGEGGATPTFLLVWHAILVALVLARLAAPGRWPCAAHPGIAGGFALFVAAVVAGAAVAPYAYAAWLTTLELLAWWAVAWLAAGVGPGLAGRLAGPLAAVAAGQSILLLVDLARGAERPAGTFLNPNHAAGWLVAVVLVAGASLVEGRRARAARVALGLALVPAVAAIAVTGSRGALAGLVAGLGVGLVLGGPEIPRTLRIRLAAAAAVVVLAAGLGLAWRMSRPDTFRWQRARIWAASASVLAERPWTGTGPGQFAAAARRHQFPDGSGPLRYDRGFSTTHSDLLRAGAELGLPATALLLGTAAAGAALAVRRRRSGALPPEAGGALGALAALGVQALVDNPSVRPALYLFAAALAGSVVSRSRHDAAPVRPAVRAVAAGALVLAFAVGDVAAWAGWVATRRARQQAPGAAGVPWHARAVAWNPLSFEPWTVEAERLAATGFASPVHYATAREAAERAVRTAPGIPDTWRALARVEAAAARGAFHDVGTRERAAAAYREAEARAPFDPFLPIERASLLLDTADPEGAAEAARRALAIEPEGVVPRLLLAAALLDAGAPGAPGRARELVADAERAHAVHADWRSRGGYPRDLLAFDAEFAAEILRRAGAKAAGAGAEPGALR